MSKSKQIVKRKKGAGRPPIDHEAYLAKIRPFLQLGYSMHKACLYADVPYRQLHEYANEHEDFRNKVERERTTPNLIARRNLVNAINKGDLEVSKDWLERLEAEEFSKVHRVKDESDPTDEGIILLREIIVARRLKAKKLKQLPAKSVKEIRKSWHYW